MKALKNSAIKKEYKDILNQISITWNYKYTPVYTIYKSYKLCEKRSKF